MEILSFAITEYVDIQKVLEVFNAVFWMSIFVIFFAAIIKGVFKAYSKDKCLKLFDGFRVTLNMLGGKTAWGTLKIYRRGIELVYDEPFRGKNQMVKQSYMIYRDDCEKILCAVRYAGSQNDKQRDARDRKSVV